MSANPLVSVVMPVYNSEKTILRAVLGIQRQTYDNIEIVLVNDGSTDNTLAVLRELEANDSRIRVIDKENGGPSTARNAGLEAARGEWIQFHDSDDWMEPWGIERMVEGTKWGTCDLVVANFYRVNKGRVHSKGLGKNGLITIKSYVQGMTLRPSDFFYTASWNKLMRRSIFMDNSLRMDEFVKFGEDHLMLTKYLLHCRNVFVVGEPMYYYLNRKGSLLHQGMTPTGFVLNRMNIFPTYVELCRRTGINDTVWGKTKCVGFLCSASTDVTLSPWDEKLDPSRVPDGIIPD